MNDRTTIPLNISPQLLKDSAYVTEQFAKQASQVVQLNQDLKAVERTLKALKQASIIGNSPGGSNTGGANSFIAGQSFRDEQRVNSTKRLGTLMGQNMETQRAMLALSRQGVQFVEREGILRAANEMSLRRSYVTINKIKDVTQVQRELEAAKVRLGLEAAAGDRRRIQSAQRIVGLYQQRLQALKAEEAEQRRIAQAEARRAKQMTDTQLVTRARNLQMQRMFGDGGATLFAAQSGVVGNFAVLNGLRSGMQAAGQFTAQLDLAMQNLQAITRTTDGNMESLRSTLIGVSEETKFTAVEVANMAVTLGQAGLSTSEIIAASRAVSLLATATGTDLSRAVDVATSVLGVFNLESSQMANVANVMTEAVNSSKLNLDKLALGLQYSGNIAAQSGIRFDELTAALGAMANAGIRSGSTLGTGMRQILTSLQAPSGELLATMDRLGLTMSDVDVRTQGLYGALANLTDAGFTSGDAIRTMEVRAAAAYNALSGNLDQMIDLETAFQGTTAATTANETQMRSFTNQMARLGSVAGSVASTGLEPLLILLRNIASMTSDVLSVVAQWDTELKVLTTTVVALGAAWALFRVGRLLVGLKNLVVGQKAATAATVASTGSLALHQRVVQATTARYAVMSTAVRGTIRAMTSLRGATALMGGPVGILLTGITLAAGAFMSFGNEASRSSDALDQARSSFDQASGRVDEMGQSISNLDDKIVELISRYDRLKTDSRLMDAEIESVKAQFVNLGLDITNVGDNVDELIANLRNLRAEMAKDYVAEIRLSMAELGALQAQVDRSRGNQAAGIANASTQYPMLQDFIDENFGLNVEAARNTLANPNASLDETRMAMVQLRELVEGVNQELEREDLNRFETGRLEDFRDMLAEVETQGAALLETALEQARLQRTATARGRDLATAEERQIPAVASVFNDATELSLSTVPRMQDAGQTAGRNDALGRYAEMRAEADRLEAEQTAIAERLRALVANGTISADNQQQIQTLINQSQGELEAQLSSAAEAAGEIEEGLRTNAISRLRADIQTLRTKISSADNEDDAEAWTEALGALIDEYAETRRDEVDQTVSDISAHTAAIQDLDAEIQDMRAQALAGYDETLDQIAADATALRQETLEAERDAANAAYDRAVDLAEAAETQAEELRWMQEAMAQLGRRMNAALALIGIEYADNPEAAALATESAETELSDDEDTVSGIPEANRKRRERGGGRDKKADDPVTKWIEAATTQVNAVNMGIANGIFGPDSGVDTVERTLDNARAQMESITGKISAMQGRLLNGTLTADEQERLNTLVRQHGELAGFVNGQEAELVRLKYEQGDIMGGLNLQVEQFAKNSLDMTSELASGLSSALGNAKNGLAEFFKSWSDGTKTGKQAFNDLAISVVKSVQDIFAQMLAVYALQRLLGFAFPGANIPQQSLGEIAGSFTGMKEGGEVKSRAGFGRDAVKGVNLMDGEFVLRRSAVQAIGVDELKRINAMGNRTVDSTGHQGVATQRDVKSGTGDGTINFYLVDERSQAGQMGPNDVLAIVTDDMTRGGPTKKLIKSIQNGTM